GGIDDGGSGGGRHHPACLRKEPTSLGHHILLAEVLRLTASDTIQEPDPPALRRRRLLRSVRRKIRRGEERGLLQRTGRRSALDRVLIAQRLQSRWCWLRPPPRALCRRRSAT